jgi:hypothetical protein
MNESPNRSSAQETDAALRRTDMLGLVVRMLDDMVRIAEAQAKLFDVNLSAALSYALDRAIGRALAAVMYLFGGLCMLGAMIALLHHYISWWQALAAAGAVIIAAGWIIQRATLAWAAKQVEPQQK